MTIASARTAIAAATTRPHGATYDEKPDAGQINIKIEAIGLAR